MVRQGLVVSTVTPFLHFYLTRFVPRYIGFASGRPFGLGTVWSKYNAFATTLLRVAVHNATIGPCIQSYFLFGMAFIKYDYSAEKGREVWRERIKKTMICAWSFWPIVMIGLYTPSLVPLKYGNLYMDTFSFFWGLILSYIAN